MSFVHELVRSLTHPEVPGALRWLLVAVEVLVLAGPPAALLGHFRSVRWAALGFVGVAAVRVLLGLEPAAVLAGGLFAWVWLRPRPEPSAVADRPDAREARRLREEERDQRLDRLRGRSDDV